MSRVKIGKGKQREFLESIKKRSNLSWDKLGALCGVSGRTIRDWRREKYLMNYEASIKLNKVFKVALPLPLEILPEHWSNKETSKLGAKRRYELYGNLGTSEGRSKGGRTTQKKFRLNPQYAREIGFKLRKEINRPPFSSLLSEFIGILLGDGGITNHQVCITCNRETDQEYLIFLQKIVNDLFSLSSSIASKKTDKADDVVISSKSLVDFLEKNGIKRGNKVRQQINIPNWIWKDVDYQISCIRGLVDTDGSFYGYSHEVNDRLYFNFAMCFTNRSKPLIKSVYRILRSLNFNPVLNKDNTRVYLHKKRDVVKYFSKIGTHNPKHYRRYNNYASRCDMRS